MGNELTRAWNLLKPDERPRGIRGDPCMDGFKPWDIGNQRSAICHAVEDALLERGMSHDMNVGTERYRWFGPEDSMLSSNLDRLTAANDALEAIRKDDDA